jgi:hypothetical protein
MRHLYLFIFARGERRKRGKGWGKAIFGGMR